jgi:ferredoxin
MAIMITDDCINCGACEPECPNNAIYEGGVEWAINDGSTVAGAYELTGGRMVDASDKLMPISDDFYYIVPDKCTECVGFHRSRNVPPFAPLTAACLTLNTSKRRRFCWIEKRVYTFNFKYFKSKKYGRLGIRF